MGFRPWGRRPQAAAGRDGRHPNTGSPTSGCETSAEQCLRAPRNVLGGSLLAASQSVAAALVFMHDRALCQLVGYWGVGAHNAELRILCSLLKEPSNSGMPQQTES
jgi:hypothetical protein